VPKGIIIVIKRCACIMTAGLWPWKSVSAKECVTTHRPNAGALKMDGTNINTDPPPDLPSVVRDQCRTVPRERSERRPRGHLELPALQILVEVAITQA